MKIDGEVCNCRAPLVEAGQVVRVDTCPVCLPRGSITWLIENGRQLELFSDKGVLEPVRGLESIERSAQDQVTKPARGSESVLPF